MLKSKIRKKILKIRKKENKKNIQIKFENFFNFLKGITNLKNKTIGGYYPVNYEIDDLNILKELENRKINIALPVVKKNFKMNFLKWSFDKPLKINKYGIPEPYIGNNVYPNILLVPLVAFDKNLNRLGYGAGYYDRLIEFLKKKKKIISVGLAFDSQEFISIPFSKYDQKLDYIVTNKSILK